MELRSPRSWINDDQICNAIVTRRAFLIIFFIVILGWIDYQIILGYPNIIFLWIILNFNIINIVATKNLFYPRPDEQDELFILH